MDFNLEQRTASLSVGELSDFTLGPRDASGAPSGLWRAQLGTHWHNQLRAQIASENSAAQFEIPITGKIVHRGWILTLTGRIDQLIPATENTPLILREIKTVTRPIPADESELRAEYPAYFVQLATYAELRRLVDTGNQSPRIRAELHFVEVASGLAQTITLTAIDDALFRAQLERVTEFLNLRLRARERLRSLRYRSPFATLRPGQETTGRDLADALAEHPVVLFEAPTGFGKTGILLELALSHMREGRFDRLIYLTSKATGQLQVTRTLADMADQGRANPPGELFIDATHPEGSFHQIESQPSVAPACAIPVAADSTDGMPVPHDPRPGELAARATPVTAWLMRPKREHCINTAYNCTRDTCAYLNDLETRWPKSGLSRFYLVEDHPRDIATLRAAGADARICPYEISRAALPFNDVWIGDYNYIFSPANRGIFTGQPGYDPERTLLVVDEAHNLPSRVADVFSHAFYADDARAVGSWFNMVRVPSALSSAWSHWVHFLSTLKANGAHTLATEDDARELIDTLAGQITATPLDYAQMPAGISETLWSIPELAADLASLDLPRLWWSPQNALLVITCLDAADAIGPAIAEFGGAILASATLTPVENFTAACGLDSPETPEPGPASSSPKLDKLGALTKRDTKKLFAKLTSAADLLALDEARATAAPHYVRAATPWRDDAYDVAIDTRVNTTYQQRAQFSETTASTIASLASASGGNVAVFFPSYAYAETIQRELADMHPAIRISMQPKLPDLAAQNAWLGQSLSAPGVVLLVLGSSFAEGIDLLGGRISHAMVVGPALPEVNPIQRARLAAYANLGRDEAARRVYQIPGIQKVNQALGRLVRAPGQRAKVLLHCRRFADKSFHDLLAPEYRASLRIANDEELKNWLGQGV
ncbi:DNA excision repair protein ERCC-2 [Ereboglobus sp. PH5-5]|uniref:ATP-dependent DNA helicase n=1 Tax=Ereboglobus sp. PH5-5 TaxID=2940529 RepID=UPI002406201E|nr:helicase C-terminal domain-containing protein [Ereboglobus sp. PH5-5]MDF9833169.1 DNA excision repair protein ERCC-2 [Ereboglobus sp. PH5-5]